VIVFLFAVGSVLQRHRDAEAAAVPPSQPSPPADGRRPVVTAFRRPQSQ
jgi:hypothetical protein